MTEIIQCTCGSRHRTHLAVIKCRYRHVVNVEGDGSGGPYALLGCQNRPLGRRYTRSMSVSLWSTLDAAENSGIWRFSGACGGFCRQEHRIVKVTTEPQQKAANA